MPFHSKKTGTVKFDVSDRRDFLQSYASKKARKKNDEKKLKKTKKPAETKKSKPIINAPKEKQNSTREQEIQKTSQYSSDSVNDKFGGVTITTTMWE
jgi:hypothetical protein